MIRPRLNIYSLENNYSQIANIIKKNNLFACQLEDGVLVMVKKQGKNLDCIMINPKNYKVNGFTSWTFDFVGLKKMYSEVLNDKDNNFYNVEIGDFSIREVCGSLVDSLYCLKTGNNYGGYRIRNLDQGKD